jgi:hypothetical protein
MMITEMANRFRESTILINLTRLLKIIPLLLILSGSSALNAQILKDSASIRQVNKCIDDIYNFQFNDAEEIFARLKQAYPRHPVTFLMSGMMIYWESYPLIKTSANRPKFEQDMRTCIDICEKKPDPSNEAEYLLANLCARGLLLLFYSDNDLTREVIPLASSTYKYVRRSFDYNNSYSDFSYFTGLYNYYREAYPEVHPVYKPLTALFPKGDKKKGLKELKIAASKSIVLKAESTTFLSYIYLSYENNYQEAVGFSQSLHDRYPFNAQYLGELIKNLLLVKKFDEAENIILPDSSRAENGFLKAQITIFNGILQEKKYHNYEAARQFYEKGIKDISLFGSYGDETTSIAYLGLSRLAGLKGDNHGRNTFRRKGMDMTSFKTDPFEK